MFGIGGVLTPLREPSGTSGEVFETVTSYSYS